jgi:hypothetical protein
MPNLFRHVIGLLWTSDQPVAKASTDTGQHNILTQRQTSMPPEGLKLAILTTKRPIRMPYSAQPFGSAVFNIYLKIHFIINEYYSRYTIVYQHSYGIINTSTCAAEDGQ